jgi:hypothetical protein
VSFDVTLQPSLPVDPASPRLRAFYAYWRGLAPAGAVPAYSGFDVVHVPRALLPFLILLEVLDAGADFRYRVVGTGVVEAIGRDFTGETVHEYSHRHEPPGVAEGYRHVRSLQAPDLYQGTLEAVGKGFIRYERLAVPFTGDAGDVEHILACFQFEGAGA